VPVLVTLGTRANGEPVVIDLRIAGEESSAAWGEVITALVKRHIGVPKLAVIDGSPELMAALQEQWKTIQIQRCTNHKLRNLQAKAPARLREELTEDYRRMIYAESVDEVTKQRKKFEKKWALKCTAVFTSLEEAGEELFTFTHFPPSQWKALRTTNAIERINEECRRRTTSAPAPGPRSACGPRVWLRSRPQAAPRRTAGSPQTHARPSSGTRGRRFPARRSD
jgi:putative transposase